MKELTISNYKCLKNIEISDLKSVNLFTGKNNTGKSTILEAVALFAAKGDMHLVKIFLEERGELNNYSDKNSSTKANLELLSGFFYNRKIGFKEGNVISIDSDTDSFSMRFEEKVSTGESNKYIFKTKAGAIERNFYLWENLFEQLPSPFFKLQDNFHFINSKGEDILNPNSASLWDKITLSEKENIVVEALQIIEPDIIRLSFIGENGFKNTRYPIVKLKDGTLHPLKAMGDGINRILNLILALVNSDNGYLLIDEVENGLHYSVQEKLWEVMFEISARLNVQVFATTHSSDSINSFAKVLENNKDYEGSLYRLARRGEEIKAYTFSTEEIMEASFQQINLR